MKVVVERDALMKALHHAQCLIREGGRTGIEALKNGNGHYIRITFANKKMKFSELVPADISEVGAVTVKTKKIYNIVNGLENGSRIELVAVDCDDMRLEIRCGRKEFIICAFALYFSGIQKDADLTTTFRISPVNLKMLIDNTSFVAGSDTSHYYLAGVYLHEIKQIDGAMLRAVATDGHCMACQDVPLPAGAEGMDGVIIPKNALDVISSLLDEQTDDIEVNLSAHTIMLNCQNWQFAAMLIPANYPDYIKVIPSNNDKVMEINSQNFRQAIGRVKICANGDYFLKILIRKGGVALDCRNSRGEAANEEIDAAYAGEEMMLPYNCIGFNYRYLQSILEKIPETVKISFSENSKPVLLQGQDVKDSLYVLMPMKM